MKKGLAGVAVAFLAWALLSILWVPPYLVTATPYRVDQDPSSRGLVFETIRIPSEDLLLEGWWIPAESPRAELIFVHGAGSNRISQFVGSLDFIARFMTWGCQWLPWTCATMETLASRMACWGWAPKSGLT